MAGIIVRPCFIYRAHAGFNSRCICHTIYFLQFLLHMSYNLLSGFKSTCLGRVCVYDSPSSNHLSRSRRLRLSK